MPYLELNYTITCSV